MSVLETILSVAIRFGIALSIVALSRLWAEHFHISLFLAGLIAGTMIGAVDVTARIDRQRKASEPSHDNP